MPKLKLLLILAAFSIFYGPAFGQKNFEGEIYYSMQGFDGTSKQMDTGQPYKIYFGQNVIDVKRLSMNGDTYQEKIIYLDSAKMVLINYSEKTYLIRSTDDETEHPDHLPWGMTVVKVTAKAATVAGLPTHIVWMTNPDTLNKGMVKLNASGLYYHLPPKISSDMVFDHGVLFFKDHIMLQIRITAPRPYSYTEYSATKVTAMPINISQFNIPAGYRLIAN